MDPDGVATIYQYNGRGEREYTATDLYQDGALHKSGTNRITQVVSDVLNNGALGADVRRTRTFVWSADNTDVSNLVSTVETSVDGLRTWSTRWNGSTAVTNKSRTVPAVSGMRYLTNTAPDGSYVVSTYSDGRLTSVTRRDSASNRIASTSYGYDAHGRQSTITDVRNGTTTYTFNNADQVETVTTPSPGLGQSAQTTTTAYDPSLRAWKTSYPDGTSLTNLYDVSGLLTNTAGSRTYPVAYTYDYAGRMATMKTWTNRAANSGAAVTTWYYDANRGWLTNKVYADGKGTIYSNTPAGRLALRRWARGLDSLYAYNLAGDLVGVDYSDSTPDLTYGYDRRGRQQSIAQASGMTTAFTFNDAGEVLTETYTGGPLGGLSVTNGFDTLLRRTNLIARNSANAVLYRATNSYDAASRLAVVSDGTQIASYSYLTDSPLVSQITFKQNTTLRMTTTKAYDYVNRLLSVSNGPAGSGQGELVIPSSPFMNDEERKGLGSRIAGCLWSKIKSKGIGKILKDLPEGVEKELLDEALGGGIDNLEDETKITESTHQIRATCGQKGIDISVFTQVTLTLGSKTFKLRTDEKKLGTCGSLDNSSIYDLGCRCCPSSPLHPDHPKEP